MESQSKKIKIAKGSLVLVLIGALTVGLVVLTTSEPQLQDFMPRLLSESDEENFHHPENLPENSSEEPDFDPDSDEKTDCDDGEHHGKGKEHDGKGKEHDGKGKKHDGKGKKHHDKDEKHKKKEHHHHKKILKCAFALVVGFFALFGLGTCLKMAWVLSLIHI